LVTFSENVTGVATTNFSLTLTGSVSGASVTSVAGADNTNTRIVTVNTGTGTGTIRLNKSSNIGISDALGNSMVSGNFMSGQNFTIDKTAPTVSTITRAQPNNTNSATRAFTVTFSENVIGVTTSNFTLTTVGIASGTASITSVTGINNIRTVTINTGTNGPGVTHTLRLDKTSNAGITDALGNQMTSSNFTTGQTYSKP